MDFVNGVTNLASGMSGVAYDINRMGTNINTYNAFTSLDPNQRKLANDRIFCINKFQWYKLKKVFLLTILPFILIFLIAFLSQYNNNFVGLIPFMFLWILFGSIYLAYLNAFTWNYLQYKINNSNEITPNNCGI